MAKLLILAACQRLIISADDNTCSLISIIEQLEIGIGLPLGQELPAKSAVPIHWYGFAYFQRVQDDEGKKLEARLAIIDPKGNVLAETPPVSILADKEKTKHRVNARFDSLPVSSSGIYALRAQVREEGGEWAEKGSYPFDVKLSIAEDGKASSATPPTPATPSVQ
jgi:hypothetical protein